MTTYRMTGAQLATHETGPAESKIDRRRKAVGDRLPWRIAAPLLCVISGLAWTGIFLALI